MRWVIVGGLVTLLSAALGWIGFGHLAVLLGLEILVGVWFARLRTIDSLGPVTAGHATRTTYVVTVDGEKVQQEFNPVPGQPLSARERLWFANNGLVVLGVVAFMAIGLGVVADPGFVDPTQLLVLGLLAAHLVLHEHRRHRAWQRLGLGRTADPTAQIRPEYWRVLAFLAFAVLVLPLSALPRLLAYTFAVVLFACDLFLHGKRERWSREVNA